MKESEFSHAYTSPQLREINNSISELLQSEQFDERALMVLVEQRDSCITQLLSDLKGQEKTQFVQEEMRVNDNLISSVSAHRKRAEQGLLRLLSGKKAVEKYK